MLPCRGSSATGAVGTSGGARETLELDKKLTLLRRAPLLAALPLRTLRSLVAASQERALAAGEIVFEEGDLGQSMYVVVRGKVVIWKQGKRIAQGGPGDCFGEMALIESKERSAGLFALTDATVIEISEAQFRGKIATSPRALFALLRTFSDRSRKDLDALARDNRKLQEYAAEVELANRELTEIRQQLEEKNRRRFDDVLSQEWKRAARDGTPLSLIYGDIDFFKGYNDAYGHQAGDECLRRVAKVLAEAAHRPADLAARYGGEEFIVLLVDTGPEGAATLAERMRVRVESLRIAHRASAVGAFLTASFGLATLVPRPGLRSEDLVERADRALYAAKQKGRNCVVSAPAMAAVAKP